MARNNHASEQRPSLGGAGVVAVPVSALEELFAYIQSRRGTLQVPEDLLRELFEAADSLAEAIHTGSSLGRQGEEDAENV